MTAIRPLVCPILVGRDSLLELADERIAEVADGAGRFLVLAGESGIGKTRLLGAIERRVRQAGFRAVRGGTYPSDLRVAGAVLLDLGRSMARASDDATIADGERLLGVLDALAADAAAVDAGGHVPGDAHRRRRLLLLDAVDALAALADAGPVLVQLEDLHWADDLTLEILEALAGRIGELPFLLIATYRSDELYPRLPTREWRARLAGRRMIEEIPLERLGSSEVATMTTALLASDLPASRDIVDVIRDRSDGIPLHVEELLALIVATDGRPGELGADLTRWEAVPDTVEDAIVARLETRSPAAVSLAQAGAVIGRSFDLDLLAAVMDRPLDDLSDAISELGDHFILLPARMPGRYGFRHALICDSIYARLSEPERRRLHSRTADAARGRTDIGGLPFLALHLEKAGRDAEAFAAARVGGEAAMALFAPRVARDLFEAALRTAPSDLPPVERGALQEALAGAAAATDDNAAADVAFEAARSDYLAGGDTIAAAAVLAPHVAVRHLLGDDLGSRTARLSTGLDELTALRPLAPRGSSDDGRAIGPGDARAYDLARARLLAAMSAALMLDRRLEQSIAYGTVAHHAAEAAGDPALSRNVATTLGACYVFAGRMDEGWAMLEGVIRSATASRFEAEASRAYRMLGSSASVLVEYPRAERFLRAGVDHAETAELWNDRHYMAAHLAHVLWATGRWAAADEVARHALADGRGGITTRITALHSLGYVAMGRGELADANGHLDEARRLAEGMRELQRLSPALWGLAEVALASGDLTLAADLVERAAAASAAVDDAAYLFPFAVTGTRVYLGLAEPGRAREWVTRVAGPIERRAIPGTLPSLDHARGLLALAEGTTGIARTHLIAAAAGWSERGRAWEGAWAYVDLARCHQRANQRTEARRTAAQARAAGVDLGAPAIVAAADGLLGRHGVSDPHVAPWAPLTAREFDVARGVARGRTNPQIAEVLGISRKTVSAHVEHILDKLGMDRRTEIAAWVAARPVLHSRPHGDDREE